MVNQLEEKKMYIKEHGEISLVNEMDSLATIEGKTSTLALFKSVVHKLKLLFEEKIREKDF
jgi:hypothetical protein